MSAVISSILSANKNMGGQHDPAKIHQLFLCYEEATFTLGFEQKSETCASHIDLPQEKHCYVGFPNVDSCIGVILKFANTKVSVAHLNGFKDGNPEAYEEVFQEFFNKLGDETILHAFIFGAVENWFPVDATYNRKNVPANFRATYIESGTVDALLDVDAGVIWMLHQKTGRTFREPLRGDVKQTFQAYNV